MILVYQLLRVRCSRRIFSLRLPSFSKDRVWRLVTFFKRGYGSWVSYVFGLANFVVLQYSLLISGIPALQSIFGSVWVFVLVFGLVVFPLTVLVGFWDYRKGSVPVENSVATLASPYNVDLAKAVCLLADGRAFEAKKIMIKWAGDLEDLKV